MEVCSSKYAKCQNNSDHEEYSNCKSDGSDRKTQKYGECTSLMVYYNVCFGKLHFDYSSSWQPWAFPVSVYALQLQLFCVIVAVL